MKKVMLLVLAAGEAWSYSTVTREITEVRTRDRWDWLGGATIVKGAIVARATVTSNVAMDGNSMCEFQISKKADFSDLLLDQAKPYTYWRGSFVNSQGCHVDLGQDKDSTMPLLLRDTDYWIRVRFSWGSGGRAGSSATEKDRITAGDVGRWSAGVKFRHDSTGGTTCALGTASEPKHAIATLTRLSPYQSWIHLYCKEEGKKCRVKFECTHDGGSPAAAWTVNVPSVSSFTYWPGKSLKKALMGEARLEEDDDDDRTTWSEQESNRRTTCEVFSNEDVEVRAYTRLGGEVIPVAVYE